MGNIKPWVLAPLELLQHAEDHLTAGSDFDKRMAMISFDNSIETSITTYLTLHPMQREGIVFQKKQVEDWLRNYHTKLLFFEEHLTTRNQPMDITRDEIVWYHNLRNELYHSGNGMVPAEYNIQGIRTVALWIFSKLFNVNAEQLLKQKISPQQTTWTQTPKVDLSGQMSFLKSHIEFESVLRATMKALGVEPDKEIPLTSERIWYLFSQIAQLPEGYDLIVLEAQTVRDCILNNQPTEYTENDLAVLASRLDQVTQYISNFIASIDILPLLLNRYPNWIRPEIVSVRLVNRDQMIFLEVVTEKGYKEVEMMNLDFIVEEISDEVDEWGNPIDLASCFRGDLSAEENARKFVEDFGPYDIGYITNLFKDESWPEIERLYKKR